MDENKELLPEDPQRVHQHVYPFNPGAVPKRSRQRSKQHHDRTRPKTTRQDPLEHRRPTARGDERGRLPRLHAVVPVPALPLGQLRGGGEEGTGARIIPTLGRGRPPRAAGASGTPTTRTTCRSSRSRCAARCITSSSREHLWSSIADLARTQNGELLDTLQKGFKYIENESFESTFQGLFSEINLGSDKLGKTYDDRNAKLCAIITEDRRRAGGVLHRHRHAGRRLRIPDRPVRRRVGQEGGRVLHAAADFRASSPASSRSTARNPKTGKKKHWTACSTSPAAPARCC